MVESNYNSNEDADIQNIKSVSELERVIDKARKMGADSIGSYKGHTAVKIGGRWYVPFLRKDQSPSDDPCLRPLSSFNEQTGTNQDFNNRQKGQPFGNKPDFEPPSSPDINKDRKNISSKNDKTLLDGPNLSSLSDDKKDENPEGTDEDKRGWKKPKKRLL